MCLRKITLAVLGAVLLAPPAMSQSPRYSGDWRQPAKKIAPAAPATPRLHLLLRELNRITSAAERDKAAHPRLLSDMRGLVRRYAGHWSRLIVSDAFRDGNLTAKPRWVVESGAFSVGRAGLIAGPGVAPTPNRPASPPPETRRRPRIGEFVIGTLLEELTREQEGERRAPASRHAADPVPPPPTPAAAPREGRLHTEVAIPNAFALHVTLRSRDATGGVFEIGVGQGARASGYRLVYRPAGWPSLSLVRVGARGETVIRSVSETVRLEDGRQHKLKLTRDIVGEMTVAVDGKNLLRLRDSSFRDDFDRVVLLNKGGDYAVRGVAVYGTP